MLHEVPLHQLVAEAVRASHLARSGTPQVDPGAAPAHTERVAVLARAARELAEARPRTATRSPPSRRIVR